MRRTWMLVVFRGQRVNCYHPIISNLANNLFFNGKAFFRSIITSKRSWILVRCTDVQMYKRLN